jgi:hypothetical protein
MDPTAFMLNQIVEIFQQFGPQRGIPAENRWQSAFPEATTDDFARWRFFCERVEASALAIAKRVAGRGLDRESALQELSQQYPDLSAKRLGDTYSQALYFAAR